MEENTLLGSTPNKEYKRSKPELFSSGELGLNEPVRPSLGELGCELVGEASFEVVNLGNNFLTIEVPKPDATTRPALAVGDKFAFLIA